MVGYPTDVEEVYFDDTTGILSGISAQKIVIDMTTSTPTLAKQIAKKARELDVLTLDAPVSGGDIGAQNRTLTIMAGGDQAAFEQVTTIFDKISKKVQYFGPAGSEWATRQNGQSNRDRWHHDCYVRITGLC